MTHRSIAIVAMHDDHPPARHFAGAPLETGLGDGGQQRLRWPRLALIVEREDGYYLERLLADGTVVGDTSHEDVQEAREQAEWEYGKLLGAWLDVPEELPEEQIPEFALGRRH